MRAAALSLIVMTAAACWTDRCKDGTVFLSVALDGGAESANWIDVTLSVDGGPAQTQSVAHRAGSTSGSIEVDFGASYPSGKALSFTIVARADELVLASSSQAMTASAGCTAVSFKLDGGSADLGTADLMPEGDLAGADLAGADLSSADLAMAADMVFVPSLVPSCVGLGATCGASGTDGCCNSPLVTGGTFYRSDDVATDNMFNDHTAPATVSDFRLDKYEVTVGRFRKFVSAGFGTQANPPAAGSGANPYLANSGWDANWNSSLTADTASLTAALKCNSTWETWTDQSGPYESHPIACLTWYEAFAFCAWDGGFLPTEAEWNYAASGGNEQRAYPWSVPASSLTIDCTYANYDINNPSGTYCVNGTTGFASKVGALSPKGDGKWGQSDLAGNVWEWTLDWYASYVTPCVDCADLTAASAKVSRGGSFTVPANILRAAARDLNMPAGQRSPVAGFRCARNK